MSFRYFHRSFVVIAAMLALSTAAFAQSAKFRVVTVTSEPAATVWVDGVKYGQTDESGKIEFGIPKTGNHSLRDRADGFAEISRTFMPAQSSLTVPLKPTTDKAELKYQEAERLAQLDRDKAIAAYREALKMKPVYINAHIGLIRVLSEARYYDQVVKAIGALKKIKPGIPEVSAIEGRVFKEIGQEEKAIASFERAIAEGNGYQPEDYAGLGLLYKEKGETAAGAGDMLAEDEADSQAIEYLAKAAEQLYTSPDAPIIYQLLGLIYEKQHRFDEAIKLYQDFLETFPDSPEAEAVRSFIVQIRKQQAREQ